MRCIVQRVKKASVVIDNAEKREINGGLVVLCAFEDEDNSERIKYVTDKILNLRIFTDENDKLNLSLLDVKGELLVVSNFTLYGDCSKGRRPSFVRASAPSISEGLYEEFLAELRKYDVKMETGKFGADMLVDISNDGPVTLIVESK